MKCLYYVIVFLVNASVLTANTAILQSEMAKFCANLGFMFTEVPFLERYQLAKNAGFKCVETGFPFGFTKEQVKEAKDAAGIDQILINTFTGDVSKGELGYAAIPGKEEEFRASINKTIEYAKTLGVVKIHIMSGTVVDVTQTHHEIYEKNLRYAVNLLEKYNILGLIEPINNYSVPHYYLNNYAKAVEIIKSIRSPNLKIMLDIFHLQHIKGNVTNTIKELIESIGHVQIAQVPNRNEPNIEGELNYSYIIKTLRNEGYTDWIGLEYKPKTDTTTGLKWISDMGFLI